MVSEVCCLRGHALIHSAPRRQRNMGCVRKVKMKSYSIKFTEEGCVEKIYDFFEIEKKTSYASFIPVLCVIEKYKVYIIVIVGAKNLFSCRLLVSFCYTHSYSL